MKLLISVVLIFSCFSLSADEFSDCVADCISEGFTSEYCSDTACAHLNDTDTKPEPVIFPIEPVKSWSGITVPEPDCEPSIEECH